MAVFVISSTFLVLLSIFVMKGVKLMLVVWLKFIDLDFCDLPGKMDKAFYFRPKKSRLGSDNVHQILPNMSSVA